MPSGMNIRINQTPYGRLSKLEQNFYAYTWCLMALEIFEVLKYPGNLLEKYSGNKHEFLINRRNIRDGSCFYFRQCFGQEVSGIFFCQ